MEGEPTEVGRGDDLAVGVEEFAAAVAEDAPDLVVAVADGAVAAAVVVAAAATVCRFAETIPSGNLRMYWRQARSEQSICWNLCLEYGHLVRLM